MYPKNEDILTFKKMPFTLAPSTPLYQLIYQNSSLSKNTIIINSTPY